MTTSFSHKAAAEEQVVVFAASSLQGSLSAVADAYAAKGGHRPKLSFGASSSLAKQIEGGAPADLYISADEQSMDELVAHNLILFGTRVDLLGNQLVLVASAKRPFRLGIQPGFALAELLGKDRLAIGDPESVAVGRYAKAALISLGVWKDVEAKVIVAQDVGSTLILVEHDEARAGIVYSTDAIVSKDVVVAGIFPEASHEPIVYPLAILAGHDRPDAHDFREFVLSPAAKRIFERYGFIPK